MSDIFIEIDDLEQKLILNGKKDGKISREIRLYKSGYNFGWQQACHILQELGLIEGFLQSLQLNDSLIEEGSKKLILRLMKLIKNCDEWNPQNEQLLEANLNEVHAKAKYILRKLKIPYQVIDLQPESEF